MKKTIIHITITALVGILIFAVVFLVFYSLSAFALYDPNPANWDSAARVFVGLFTSCTGLIACILSLPYLWSYLRQHDPE